MKNLGKRPSKTQNKGLSAPILALILVVAGVALTVVAMSMAGGFLFGWGTGSRVTIERLDILVDPATGNGFITVDIRNSGGSVLTNCVVEVQDGGGNTLSSPTGPTTLNPGQIGSYSENAATGFQSGNIYIAIVTCDGPANNQVVDKKSAVAHI
ncbi:MAG: hypothetical protein QXD47_08740 [Candidatus Caldarchaeum sp.]